MVDAPPLGLRILPDRDGVARVALMQIAASLVDGDDVALIVDVGRGAALELSEISATLAHPVASGAPIQRQTAITVQPGGRLVVIEQPTILAAGTWLNRSTKIELGEDARALLRDTVVLGREGEQPGRSHQRLRVTRARRAILDETLDTSSLDTLRSAAVVGSARVVCALSVFGTVVPADEAAREQAFLLQSGDVIVRRLLQNAGHIHEIDALTERWLPRVMTCGKNPRPTPPRPREAPA